MGKSMIVVTQRTVGVSDAIDTVSAIQAAVDKATKTAVKKSQTVAKRAIKSGMNGAPRWTERGPIGRSGGEPGVSGGAPWHRPRGGGIGKLTGHLRSAVGGVRRPVKTGPAAYTGGVGCGGPRSITNIYRFDANGKFPFVKPGVDKASPAIEAVFKAAWAAATEVD